MKAYSDIWLLTTEALYAVVESLACLRTDDLVRHVDHPVVRVDAGVLHDVSGISTSLAPILRDVVLEPIRIVLHIVTIAFDSFLILIVGIRRHCGGRARIRLVSREIMD